MKQNGIYRGEWAGCSDFNERRRELMRNHESEELKALIARGFKPKAKRPRIKVAKNPRQVVVTLGGDWTLKLSFEEYKQRGDGLKVVMKIY